MESDTAGDEAARKGDEGVKQTLGNLDLLLGIEDKSEEDEAPVQTIDSKLAVSVSPAVLRVIAEAEAARASEVQERAQRIQDAANAAAKPAPSAEPAKARDSADRLIAQARLLAGDAKGKGKPDAAAVAAAEESVRAELEKLVGALAGSLPSVDEEDVQRLKKEVFGANTFWVTGSAPSPNGGLLVRGNLRGPAADIFAKVQAKCADMFGDKYLLRMVADEPENMEDSEPPAPDAPPRVAFELLPRELAEPEPTAGWQRGAVAVLLLLTVFSAADYGLTSCLGLLPKETLAWLADPANVEQMGPGMLPPGLEAADPLPFLGTALLVGGLALAPQLAHEAGHAVIASMRGIKTAPSFLIPNGGVGTFGSVTQIKSWVKSRTDLLDFAAGGLLAGGAASLALFFAGLAASHGLEAGAPGAIPLPPGLLDSSLLLGGAVRAALGAGPGAASPWVSPMLLGGWAGLVATALNCLPVGNLDGGRAMLSAYGRTALSVSSFLTYACLGLGLVGGGLALPFGLYVLICQRTPERLLQDEVSGVSSSRKGLVAALTGVALLVLLPLAGDPALDSLGGPGNFL